LQNGWYDPAGTTIELRGGDSADARGGGGSGASEGGKSGRRCVSGRGGASGRCAPVRGGRRRDRAHRRRETAMHACRGGASRRGGAAGRRGASRQGGARRGEVVATMSEEERREVEIWGETAKCRSGRRRGLYRNTPPFVTGRVPNRD
jgi:hypothetical protein